MNLRAILKENETAVRLYEESYRLRMLAEARISYWKKRILRSSREKENIYRFKDKCNGERCFIVGTGPSLTKEDLNLIKNEISFSVNHGYQAYKNCDWRADYYVLMDDNIGSDMYEGVLSETKRLKALFCSFGNYHGADERVVKLLCDSTCIYGGDDKRIKRPYKVQCGSKISEDIAEKVYIGKTVVYVAIQIAIYMGFKEIYLLGVDCNYDVKDIHAAVVEDAEIPSQSKRDRLHNAGKLMIEQFEGIAQLAPYYGVRVYNASRGGMLEAFPRVQLEEVLKKQL